MPIAARRFPYTISPVPASAPPEVRQFLEQLRGFLTLKFRQLDEADALFFQGTGTPEGAVAAPIGALYLRTDGAASTVLYVKESGTAKTGWVAK